MVNGRAPASNGARDSPLGVGAAYFENHRRVRSFPWSLYHAPLEAGLMRFLEDVAVTARSRVRTEAPAGGVLAPEVLVIGCGLLQELDTAPLDLRFTVIDIDARAVELARRRGDPRIVRAEVVAPDHDLSKLGRFDAAYAKEVIEHIPAYPAYLGRLRRALVPGGQLWLSTPNYGEPWLPLIEYTFLEAVARASGYTRFGIHPAKFSAEGLRHALTAAGFTHVDAHAVALRLALVATARVPSAPAVSAQPALAPTPAAR
jgi:2-polyprenyl-3-methyl-5-hydroxy-6-metoxy-1,4-benzoquinol methylase